MAREGDSESQIVRKAILVHAGNEGSEMMFMSGDGPISFDRARIKRVVKNHNAFIDQLAAEYGGEDKIPIGAYDPILDSHSTGSNDCVIGRLTGRLKFEIRDIPKVGKSVPCAVADPGITFLGKDTVERVKDGRIYHLSIGINEKNDRLGETSTVVKPAAPGAMLLGDGKKSKKGGSVMSVDIKRMKAHTEKLAKLSTMKELVSTSTKKLIATQDQIRLTQKTGAVTHRLTQAMRAGKMTPAEYKEVIKNEGLTRLASLDDATLNIALMPFEARQSPVVRIGQIGSTDTPDFSQMAKDMAKQKDQNEYKRLRSEVSTDFKRMGFSMAEDDKKSDHDFKKELSEDAEKQGAKLAGSSDSKPVAPGADEHVVPGQEGDESQLKAHLHAMGKHLAAGNVEGVRAIHAEMCKMHMGQSKHMAADTGDVKSEDYQKSMMELQKQVDDLNTQMSRMGGMVEEMMSAEKQEGEHFGDMSTEHAAVAPGVAS